MVILYNYGKFNSDLSYTGKPLKMPRIGVDLDDTVIEFVAGLILFHNEKYGHAHERNQFTNWNIHETWGCTEEEGTRRIVEFYHSDHHQEIGAVPGALEALLTLSVDYDLVVITARDAIRAPLVLPLIERHFGSIFSDVHFLGHQMSKGDKCAELGVRFLVDDALHNAHSVGEKGIPVFLMNQPWNQGTLPRNTIRTANWQEVIARERLLHPS